MKRFALPAAALLAAACAAQPPVDGAQPSQARAPDKPTQSINSTVSGDRKNNTQPTDQR